MPWVIAKDEDKKDRLVTVLYNLLDAIRHGAVLLQAFLPETSDRIFKQLNTSNTDFESIKDFSGMEALSKVGEAEVLFARIETK